MEALNNMVQAKWQKRFALAKTRIENNEYEQVSFLRPFARSAIIHQPKAYMLIRDMLEYYQQNPWGISQGMKESRFPCQLLDLLPETWIKFKKMDALAIKKLHSRAVFTQPGYKRIYVHATRRKARDCGAFLAEEIAFYLWSASRREEVHINFVQMYQILKSFVASYEDLRFRLDKRLLARIDFLESSWS